MLKNYIQTGTMMMDFLIEKIKEGFGWIIPMETRKLWNMLRVNEVEVFQMWELQ